MEAGDLHLADVPYNDGSLRSRVRPVLIVKQLDADEVLVVESRGKPHPHLADDLIGVVDFTRRGYLGTGISGQSHFYLTNLRVLKAALIQQKPFGALTPQDFRKFYERINPCVKELEKNGTKASEGDLPGEPPAPSQEERPR